MEKYRKEKGLVVFTLFTLLLVVVGATYAFFQAQKGSGGNAEIEVGAGTTDSLTFHVGTPINITASSDDFYQGASDKSGTTTAMAKLVPNNNTNQAQDKYNVYFIIDQNDFTYSTEDKQVELLLKVKNPDHGEVASIEGLIYKEDLQGFDITMRHGTFKITVDDEISANSQDGTEETWEFEVILRNLTTNQQENTGKTFQGKVLITTEEKETYVMPEINSIIENSKDYESITVNLLENEKHTEEIDKYYYAIEETDEEPAAASIMSIAEKLEPNYVESDEPTHTFRELNGEALKDNQNYKIYAYSKDVQGIMSAIKTAIIKTDEYLNVKVTDLTLVNKTLTSIKVKATAVAGTKNVKEYAFKIENHDTYGNWSEWQASDEYEFTGLVDTTNYNIQVKVRDELDRESVDSFDKEESTETYVYPSVKTFTVSDITSSIIKVNGTLNDGTGTVSKVEYQRNGDANWYQGTNTNGTYSYSFGSLTKATAYTFKIKVTDSNNREKIFEDASYKGTTLNNYLVKATVSGGTATPTQATVDHGKSTTFAIAATTGYNLSAATVSEAGCTFNTDKTKLTVSNVTAATTCTVTIPKLEYNVTVNVTGGTVDKSPKSVKYNENVTFTITASSGYDITTAKVTGGTGCTLSNGNKTLTASNVTSARTCTVTILKTQTLSSYVISKVGTSGSGTLAQHTTSLANSAKDNSYRYSGNNPNNFVCFGNGSENYNNGGDTCPDTNLYRIIGVFGNQIKLIKSEYITSAELGIASDGKPSTGSYDTLKRVKVAPSDGFNWNKTDDNTWGSSTLYQALNGGYLSKLGTTWKNKIATTTWHVGGHNTYEVTPKVMYDVEIKSSPTVSAQIGLMYASDYGFASEQNSWASSLYGYDNAKNNNRENNWLFNNVYEWTISLDSRFSNLAFYVYDGGGVRTRNIVNYACGVRPSFYLNTNVNVIVDTTKDGSVSKPFRIVV